METLIVKNNLVNKIEKTEILARWIALYEAVNIIYDKADEKGLDEETIELKPLDIKDYMDFTVDIYHRQILKDIYKIDVFYDDKN